MDSLRFDRLVRVLASRHPRRAALPLLALLGLGLIDPDEAGAAKSGKCKQKPGVCERCDRGKCERKHGEKTCKAGKIKPKANGTACSGGTCQSGSCIGPTGLVVGPTGLTGLTGPAGPAGPGAALICPTVCSACEECNPATAQCEPCPLTCNQCVTLADRSTWCGGANWECAPNCLTSADCANEPLRKTCVHRTTLL